MSQFPDMMRHLPIHFAMRTVEEATFAVLQHRVQESVDDAIRALRQLEEASPWAEVKEEEEPPQEEPRSTLPSFIKTPRLTTRLRRYLTDETRLQQEVTGSKALLLEIVRRAAYDWVLYRQSRRMLNRKMAEDAYHWLFVENSVSEERKDSGKELTSFTAICEALDLDVEIVRKRIRTLTVKNVMSVGRPAEYRRRECRDEDGFARGKIDDDALGREHRFNDEVDDGFVASPFDRFDSTFLGES